MLCLYNEYILHYDLFLQEILGNLYLAMIELMEHDDRLSKKEWQAKIADTLEQFEF